MAKRTPPKTRQDPYSSLPSYRRKWYVADLVHAVDGRSEVTRAARILSPKNADWYIAVVIPNADELAAIDKQTMRRLSGPAGAPRQPPRRITRPPASRPPGLGRGGLSRWLPKKSPFSARAYPTSRPAKFPDTRAQARHVAPEGLGGAPTNDGHVATSRPIWPNVRTALSRVSDASMTATTSLSGVTGGWRHL